MTLHTFTMTEEQAVMIHRQMDSHCQALKNWTAGAVESGKFEYAQKLVTELREYQKLFAAFNMSACRQIAESTGKPLQTQHIVR